MTFAATADIQFGSARVCRKVRTMEYWRLRFALGVVSAFLAACGGRAGDATDIALGYGTHFCRPATQTLTAGIRVTLDAH
jgi:hypothetical protein